MATITKEKIQELTAKVEALEGKRRRQAAQPEQ